MIRCLFYSGSAWIVVISIFSMLRFIVVVVVVVVYLTTLFQQLRLYSVDF
jgi:hypothetical protein